MADLEGYLRTNRDLWDGWAEIHRGSSFYSVDEFVEGASSLNDIELEALGDVAGKRLLHLQCHFGLDTLSWARVGAEVTGVDFSPRAIEMARLLAAETNLPAHFHCLEVTQLPEVWSEAFDVAFTSYGVLPWLPDLASWARTIERVLAPGGSLHLVEFHPFTNMLDDDGRLLRYPYFASREPDRYEVEGSYADPAASFRHSAYEWAHSLEEVFMSLTGAGLSVCEFREFPYSPYGCFEYLEESAPGRWTVRDSAVELPLVYRLRADKPAEL